MTTSIRESTVQFAIPVAPAYAKLPLLASSFRRYAPSGSTLDLTAKQVSNLMTKLRDSHIGEDPNRVSHDGTQWHIKPPRNYSLSKSLPDNKALFDRRSVERMEKASNELKLLKSAMSTMSPEVQKQVSMAVARESAVPIRPPFSSGAGTEVEAASSLIVELALQPVDPITVVNAKVARPQTTKSMVATVFARQPAMSARQFGATFAEITVASREALSSVRINQVDTRDAPSAVRSLSALSDGDLAVLGEALRLRRGLEPEQLPELQAKNQAHLDAAAVVVAPSHPTVTNWIKGDCAIAESVARFSNEKADFRDYAWICTDKGGKADFKQASHRLTSPFLSPSENG